MADEPKTPPADEKQPDTKPEESKEEKPAEEEKTEDKKEDEKKPEESKEVDKDKKPEEKEKEDDKKEEKTEEKKEEKPKDDKKEEGEEKKPEERPEEKKEEKKDDPHAKKEEPKKEEKPKLSKTERKKKKLDKENTDPKIMELVEDIHEIAEDLEEFNEELEEEQAELEKKTPKEAKPEAKTKENTKDDKEEKKTEEKEDEKPEEENKDEDKPEDEKPEEEKKGFLKKLFSKKKKEKKLAEDEEEKPQNKKKKLILIIVLAIFIPIIAFAGITGVLANSAYKKVQKTMVLGREAVDLLKSQNLPEAGTKLGEVKASLEETQKAYNKIGYLRIFPGIGKFIEDGKYGLSAAISGVEAGQLLIDTINPYADLFGLKGEGSFQGGTTEERIALILGKMGEITPSLDQIAQKLNQVQTDFDQINPEDYPETFRDIPVRSYLTQAHSLLDQGNTLFTDALPMLNVLPKVFGYPDQQKYMVIFQNDGELRATGGFMSAYSLVNILNGKVVPEFSNDIYHLDNQFRETIEPPEFIKTHLNEKKLYLRNMNTSPDFMVSMDTFYENYSTIKDASELNGIIAIDTYVLEKIIEILGPVEVPGYGTFTTELDDRCNLPQVVCELEFIIDKPLATVKSNRKADILGPMMQAILAKIFEGGNEQLGKLVPLGMDLLEQKHVLTYFTDETVQQAAEAFNIAGRVEDYDGDYLHINDSNLGGAKSNFYITQEVVQKMDIAEDGTIKKTVEIAYTHNEPGDNCNLEAGQLCLSGIQRNYFRVYVPEGSVLQEGLGSQVEITTGTELGKTYFDGFFELRPESKAKVMLVYTLPFNAEGETYKLLTQKQPGTRDIAHTVELSIGAYEEFILHQDTELELSL